MRRSRSLAPILTLLAALCVAAPPLVARQPVSEVARELLERAELERSRGDVAAAAATYEELIRLEPGVATAYVALAAFHQDAGDAAKALAVLERGLRARPDDRDLLFNTGIVALRTGDAARAEEALRRAAEVAPRDAAVRALRAQALRALERPADALAELDRAIDLEPDARHHFARGNLLHQLDRKEDAIEAYQRAIRLDKSMLRAYYNLGAVLFELGRYDEALAAYAKALEPLDRALAAGETVEPAHAKAYANRGAIYAQRHDWKAAAASYATAARLAPNDPTVAYNLGYASYQLGQDAEALAAYQRALTVDPELPLAYLHLGLIHARRGDQQLAAEWLERSLARLRGDDRQTALRALAASRTALGDTAGAEAAYRDVLQGNPTDLATLLGLAGLLRQRGAVDEATTHFATAYREHPGDSRAAFALAELARQRGDAATEERLLDEMLVRASGQPAAVRVRARLALLYLRSERHAKAASALDELLARPTPGLDTATVRRLRTARAVLDAQRSDLPAARKRLEALLADAADFRPARAALGVVQALAGDRQAATTLDQAGPAGTWDPLAAGNLALARWQAGNPPPDELLARAAGAIPAWSALRLAQGTEALARRELAAAIRHLDAARSGCDRPPTIPAGGDDRVVVALGGGSSERRALCTEVERRLGAALALAALDALPAAIDRRGGEARAQAERALTLPLDPRSRALALYVRGTAALAAGDLPTARGDLERSVQGGLEGDLRALAHNNLGVALARSGQRDAAVAALTRARGERLGAATLNLGILLDEPGGEPQRAKQLFAEYLASGGSRSADVRGWLERLERLYP